MPSSSATARPRPDALAIRVLAAADLTPQPWKNGGGRTRELLAWPSADAWALRISMADIESDGPFSAYPGIERWFAVVTGNGVILDFASGERVQGVGDAPLNFAGADAPGCRLADGPIRDLNLMLKDGRGVMLPVRDGIAWSTDFAVRALFTAVPGRWSAGGSDMELQRHALLWDDAPRGGDWRFEQFEPAVPAGWWLGFSA